MGNPDLNKLAEVAPDVRRISTKEAEANFEPVKIIKHAGNAILVSEEVWRGLTETLNLVSILACEASYAPECVNLLRSQQKVWIDKMDAFLMNFIGLVWLLEDTSV